MRAVRRHREPSRVARRARRPAVHRHSVVESSVADRAPPVVARWNNNVPVNRYVNATAYEMWNAILLVVEAPLMMRYTR